MEWGIGNASGNARKNTSRRASGYPLGNGSGNASENTSRNALGNDLGNASENALLNMYLREQLGKFLGERFSRVHL